MPKDKVIKLLKDISGKETKWRDGMISGTVYHGGDDTTQVISAAFSEFAVSNPLHPDVFPSIRKMEAEIVQMCCEIFRGDENCCGTMTSGGTESIVMAVKTYRDWAKDTKGIEYPELIKPVSAHAAFDKACHYLGVKMIEVPVDPVTFKVEISAISKAVNRNTIVIVASAITYPQGVMDDIPAIAKIALSARCGLHVDNCLGSLLLPFLPAAGYSRPPFDFSVEGVTSLSADTHKYGFAPKGSSVILYRTHELRHFQYFVAADWTGGIYATPSLAGSRSGAIIAGTWAAMMYMGKEGYISAAQSIMQVTHKIAHGIMQIAQLKLLGSPDMSVVCFTSNKSSLNIFNVGDAMSSRGWSLSILQFPASIHLCVTNVHTKGKVAEKFLEDLQASIVEVETAEPGKFKDGMGAIYGMAESIPDRSLVDSIAKDYIDALYAA
ncbi:hypothetical protein GUITHDRAFT_97529 [Guillardia theta CCMP2712]|uniref:sphinganine-1-phosphate aldolase n=1 Tax=Guillardia theta (strain CCMP2712) TaxID=905079 RepID=L1IK03_GUITC|nr:hypothetical protein GUITHDRAFT_97529 [Guillardia theta CCMP2712]EKX36578.1 hypothetical protein GUITHDRAFT_97529 [Guillardia theta CCMP2712]|eukprot:XP_005823558.1 hypothetical protein GUITHDRAFT_97529 [Guillardia theta CCMP2712]